MAGFQGFEGFDFERSADVKAEFQEGLQRALSSGNPDMMGAANMQQVAFTLAGGTPQYREAKKKEEVIRNATKTATTRAADEGVEDEVKQQIIYYEEAQKAAVEAGLPEIAMQSTMQLSQLRLMQEERQRLFAQSERDQAEEAREAATFKIQHEVDQVTRRHLTNGVLIDPESLKIHGRYDQTNADDLASMAKAKEETPGLMWVTEQDYLELTEAEKARKHRIAAAGSGWEGRSSLYKDFYKSMQTTDAFAISADDFTDLLLSPEAEQLFAAGGDLRGVVERAAYHAKTFFGDGHQELLAEDFEQFGNSQTLKDAGVNWNALGSDKKALVMELGYALATTRESGRLTDQDVERAILSLGLENPDPRAVAWVFGRALQRSRDQWAGKLRNSGLKDLDAVRQDHQATLDALSGTLSRLEDRYQINFDDSKAFQRFTTGATAGNLDLDDDGIKVGAPRPSTSPRLTIQVPD